MPIELLASGGNDEDAGFVPSFRAGAREKSPELPLCVSPGGVALGSGAGGSHPMPATKAESTGVLPLIEMALEFACSGNQTA